LTGDAIVSLNYDSATDRWVVPVGSKLTSDATLPSSQVDRLLTGGLYVDAHSVASPDEQIRRQLTPKNVFVAVGRLSGDQEIPAVSTTARGMVATTLDPSEFFFSGGKLRIDVHASAVNDATSVGIYSPFSSGNGPIYQLRADGIAGHWSLPRMSDDSDNSWKINILTPAFPQGQLRGAVPYIARPTYPNLDLPPGGGGLQETVFTPKCTSCHNGSGTVLPGSMDLSAGHTVKSLVNAYSVEQPTKLRVWSRNVSDSYIVQKLYGGLTPTGQHSLSAAPYLDSDSITAIRAWIGQGT
jgi:CHRD domain